MVLLRNPSLTVFHHADESRQVADVAPVLFREAGQVFIRDYEMQIVVEHFLQLVWRDALLKREKVFVVRPVCLVQNLTPTVFARGFCAQHRQQITWEGHSVVAFAIREDEVRLFLFLRDDLLFKHQFVSSKDVSQMVLQWFSCSWFPAVQDFIRHRDKVIDAGERFFYDVSIHFLLHVFE